MGIYTWKFAESHCAVGKTAFNMHYQEVIIPEMVCFAVKQNKTLHTKCIEGFLKEGKKADDLLSVVPGLRKVVNDTKNNCLQITDDEDNLCAVYHNEPDDADEQVWFYFSSINKETFDTFLKKSSEIITKEEKERHPVYMLTSCIDGLSLTEIGEMKQSLERGNYMPNILGSFDHICKNLKQTKTCMGKLVILSGIAGSGKTNMVKGIIEDISKETMCIILPSNMITSLDGPQLVTLMLSYKKREVWNSVTEDYEEKISDRPFVFIAEDCDEFLVPRENSNSSLMSGLLNLTDGIVSDLLNVRFIATTNADHLLIDDALKRPGRLLSHCSIDDLPPEKCNEIYQRITEGKGEYLYKSYATLAQIYGRAHNVEEYVPVLEQRTKKVGFG